MISIQSLSKYLSSNISLFILFILFLLCLLSFQFLPFDTRTLMLDTHFGFNSHEVDQIIVSLGDKGRNAYVFSMYSLDLLFPLIYVSLMLGVLSRLNPAVKFVYLLPIFAFMSDILQNIQTSILIGTHSSNKISTIQVAFASYTNQIKWLLVLLVIIIILFLFSKKFFFYFRNSIIDKN